MFDMFMIPTWALDDGEVPINATQNTIITQKLDGTRREWSMKNGQLQSKTLPHINLNPSGCCCSRYESYTCTAPCGYPAYEKERKEREAQDAKANAELKKKIKEENKDADEAFSSKYLKGLFKAFEDFMK